MFYTSQYVSEEFSSSSLTKTVEQQLLMSPTVDTSSFELEYNYQKMHSTGHYHHHHQQQQQQNYSSFFDYPMQPSNSCQNQDVSYTYQNYSHHLITISGSSLSDLDSEMDNYSSWCDQVNVKEADDSIDLLNNQQSNNGKRKRKRVLNKIQRQEATVREKRRMIKLNTAFEDLRKVLPINDFSKNKLSRAETLKSAIEYIQKMSQLLSLL